MPRHQSTARSSKASPSGAYSGRAGSRRSSRRGSRSRSGRRPRSTCCRRSCALRSSSLESPGRVLVGVADAALHAELADDVRGSRPWRRRRRRASRRPRCVAPGGAPSPGTGWRARRAPGWCRCRRRCAEGAVGRRCGCRRRRWSCPAGSGRARGRSRGRCPGCPLAGSKSWMPCSRQFCSSSLDHRLGQLVRERLGAGARRSG